MIITEFGQGIEERMVEEHGGEYIQGTYCAADLGGEKREEDLELLGFQKIETGDCWWCQYVSDLRKCKTVTEIKGRIPMPQKRAWQLKQRGAGGFALHLKYIFYYHVSVCSISTRSSGSISMVYPEILQ